MSSTAHFVLVHGASHGGWCWYKIRCLLECAGHKVSCPDLRAAGIDSSDANTIFEFKEYNRPLDDLLSGLDEGERVILVGHSAGGRSVMVSMNNYPEKIQAAVFLAAGMYRDVETPTPRDDINVEVLDCYYGEGNDQPPTSTFVKKERQRHLFYNRSPLEDITMAAMLLRPAPLRALLMCSKFVDHHNEEIDKVPRVYIKTLDDNTISLEVQEKMIKNWPPDEVYSIDSDHSPFFSSPFELFGLLLKIATNY